MHSSDFVNWPQIWVFCKLDFMCDLCIRTRLLCFVWGSASCHLETPSFQSTVWSLLRVPPSQATRLLLRMSKPPSYCFYLLATGNKLPDAFVGLVLCNNKPKAKLYRETQRETRSSYVVAPHIPTVWSYESLFYYYYFFFFILRLQFLQGTQCPLRFLQVEAWNNKGEFGF